MTDPLPDGLSRLATRVAYGARQLPRFAWYVGHNAIMRRLAQAARQSGEASTRAKPHTDAPVPDRNRLYADMAALFRQDLANVEAGIYPLPADHDGPLPQLLARSRLFFEDLPDIHRRRENGEPREVFNEETRGKRPAYYLQNFHFQSGGWMTRDSARRYDTQVEVLLHGTANVTRRQVLPPLAEIFAGRDQRSLRLLDIGCGTGRALDCCKQVWPRLAAIGIDLSEAYVAEARQQLRRWGWVDVLVANAEAIPLADASQDAVTADFLFHELPPKVRRTVLCEVARVLKPGGRLVILDSLQRGDEPDYDGMLELFPQNYHEPYYVSYLDEEFAALGASCGLALVRTTHAFVSKVMVLDKH
ncbi:MAG TPA: class I SAM-dependent methyltransferase [Xanthobacteraceae bacterium]|nr:class I SAM-dependent methyltransferase [Xanthobacteraceae bacterium]